MNVYSIHTCSVQLHLLLQRRAKIPFLPYLWIKKPNPHRRRLLGDSGGNRCSVSDNRAGCCCCCWLAKTKCWQICTAHGNMVPLSFLAFAGPGK